MTLLPFITRDKKGGVVLVMRVVLLRGRVHAEGCSEDYLYLFLFFLFEIHHILYIVGLVTVLTYIVPIFILY